MTEHWTREHAAERLRRPGAHDDKYRRGVLGLRTGSTRYPGAAVLGASAAWRTGAGMVRYLPGHDEDPPYGLPTPAAAVLAAHPETVFGPGRCDAWVIGSGTDPAARSALEQSELLELLHGSAPVVVDAGALDLVPRPSADRAPLILTPHAGEFERLWERTMRAPLPREWVARPPADAEAGGNGAAARQEAARRLAERLDATLLLKGSVTLIASPGGRVLSCGPATPWLASAGTGDVLAGILGALVAARSAEVRDDPESLGPLGATAAVLHDAAARSASGDPAATAAGRPITAGDVAQAIPAAWRALV